MTQQERYALCMRAAAYLQELNGSVTAMLDQVQQQKPSASVKDIAKLGDIVKAIHEQNRQRQPQPQPQSPAVPPAAAPGFPVPPAPPAPPAEQSAVYRQRLQQAAADITERTAAPAAPATAAQSSAAPLNAAESALFETAGAGQAAPELKVMDKAQVRQINQAVDTLMQQEETYSSPLAANFAPPPAPPQDLAPAADDLPPAFIDDEVPPPEDLALPPEGDFEEPELIEAEQESAGALLTAAPPQQGMELPPQAAPQTMSTAGGLSARRSPQARPLSPVKALPVGYILPKFPGLKQVTADDFYQSLAKVSPWYQLIEKTGLPSCPERSALLYAAPVKGPESDGVLELNMSEEFRTFIEGGQALKTLQESLSRACGRAVQLKINFVSGVPQGAPSAEAAAQLSAEVEQKRAELSRNFYLNDLLQHLGEDLSEAALTLYRETAADPVKPARR